MLFFIRDINGSLIGLKDNNNSYYYIKDLADGDKKGDMEESRIIFMLKKIFLIIVIIIMSFMVLVSGYNLLITFGLIQEPQPRGEYMVYYNGSIYDYTTHWYPTGNSNKKDKAWFGFSEKFPESQKIKGNTTIMLYDNDPETLFFTYKPWLGDNSDAVFYHKKDDILPEPFNENAIIVLEISGKPDIIIEQELLDEFKQFIEKCLRNYEQGTKEEKMNEIATVKVLYKDYPAYQYFSHIGVYNEKILMRPLTSSDKYIYYTLPDNLSKQIKQLIDNS